MFPFFSRMFPGTNLQDLNLDWIVRRIMELSKGIIAPWINPQNFHWMVYDTASETFVDSGVSSAGEGTGPQGEPGKSPVIGSNGNWYTWDIETEAYQDTGTHAEGPEGPIGPTGQTGPAGPAGPAGAGVNNNLLDNANFVYNKTIDSSNPYNSNGTFPINQNGQGSYNSAGLTIDRWRLLQAGNMEIVSEGLNISAASAGEMFGQRVDNPQALLSKKVTISVILDDILRTRTFDMPDAIPAGNVSIGAAALGPKGVNAYLRTQNGVLYFLLYGISSTYTPGTVVKLSAAKLEIGETQTLAHNAGTAAEPNWVIDDIPSFEPELAKCQRYFQLYRTEALRPTYGVDCRPVMAADEPSKSTLVKDGVTYYTLSV